MRRLFLVRRLYEERFRERCLIFILALLFLYYAAWSVAQQITLDATTLRFDFVNYFGGAQAAAHGGDIYAEFKRSWGSEAWVTAYIYPPFFALLLAPLTLLGLLGAGHVWLAAVQVAFFAAIWMILRVNPELSRTGRLVFLIASFAFMPVYLNLKFQQVATLWLLLLTAMLWAALRKREGQAGFFLALAASLKVGPVFFIPFFARLGRWRTALFGAGWLVLVTGASLLLAPGSWQFFTVVLPRIGLGTNNWDNGSVDGLVSRIAEYFPYLFGRATPAVGKFAIASAVVAILGLTLFLVGRSGSDSWALRLGSGAFISALLMVSSVTWQHHLVTLLLPIGIGMAWMSARKPPPVYGLWLTVSYALCWLDRRAFPLPADHLVRTAEQAVLVLMGTSVKLLGLSLMWLLFLRMIQLERRAIRRQELEPQSSLGDAA